MNKRYVAIFIIIIIIFSFYIGYSYINNNLTSNSIITVNKYNCTQSNLYDRLSCQSVLDNVKSKYVSSNLGINFTNISSDTNGKGIYKMALTETDTYPISYYRGEVDNNNLKFTGYCWKIVRTTNTGGTKIIYNGEPDTNGYCSNSTGTNTSIGSSKYNANFNSPSYVGYMYGKVYDVTRIYFTSITEGTLYGKSVKYENSKYYLQDTTSSQTDINNHHYTCLNTQGECTNITYLFRKDSEKFYSIELSNNTSILTALNNMIYSPQNNSSSIIKQTIDAWYSSHMTSYTSKIEDTVYCNDRSLSNYNDIISGWNDLGDVSMENQNFNSGIRIENNNPSLTCHNKNDSFTVSDTTNGNGALTYPVGLLTADEVILAGNNSISNNTKSYLYTNNKIWLMTPFRINNGYAINANYNENGKITSNGNIDSFSVRPVISLNHSQVISSGDGTENNPYVIN